MMLDLHPEDGGSMTSETLVSYITIRRQTSPWRWRQHGPPKRWYPTSLHGVKIQKSWIMKDSVINYIFLY